MKHEKLLNCTYYNTLENTSSDAIQPQKTGKKRNEVIGNKR